MDAWIAGIGLTDGALPIAVDVMGILLTVLAVAGWIVTGHRRRRVLVAVAAGLGGALAGLALCWLLSDRLDLFDVSLSPISRAWVAGAFAATALGLVVLLGGRGRWRAIAAGTVVMALLAGALGVNADFGQYTTLGSLADASVAPPLPASVLAAQRGGAPGTAAAPSSRAMPLWRHPAAPAMPLHGLVGRVHIPATTSHFDARAAYVYLPPAALVAHPVPLPVLVMLSGQPGAPENIISSGRLPVFLDAYAGRHHGLTPIVVIPDQLGAPDRNPMCVDGALGASESYLTVDVPRWIRTHLTVQTGRAAWAIGGFSQGGTCSIQLGAGHPRLFSAILDISGQVAPKNGDLAQTIAIGFAGHAAAYRAASPLTLLAQHAPYRSTVAVFGVGQLDTRYGPETVTVSAAAAAAGMTVTRVVSPGTAHDWHTVQYVFEHGLDPVLRHLGLARPT